MNGKQRRREERREDAVVVGEQERADRRLGVRRQPGHYSNEVIRRRNGGVRHQFERDIGGCSDNYR